MKAKLFITALLLFMGLSAFQSAHAQIDDSLPPWFKAPLEMIGDQDFMIKGRAYIIPAATFKTIKAVPTPTAKKLNLPAGVRRVPTPITLTYKGTTYKVGCQKSEGCEKCGMFWYDKNKDKKIQPRQELRCICTEGGKCKVRAKKVESKK
jgi:hypothetical protein